MKKKPFTFLSFLKNLGVMIGIATLLILLFFYIYLPTTTKHNETITVPDLVGISFDQIEEYVVKRNLRYEIVSDSGYSESYEPLTVLTQNPKAGSKVKENRKIYLSVNAVVPPKIKMPNLINTTLENAIDILESNGLKKGEIEYIPNRAINAVLVQKIDGDLVTAGTFVSKGSVIDLVIGNGEGNQQFPTPDFLGKTLEEARFQIDASNLKLDIVNYIPVDTVRRYVIYKQLPPVGAMIRTGDLVEIWVNRRKPADEESKAGNNDIRMK